MNGNSGQNGNPLSALPGKKEVPQSRIYGSGEMSRRIREFDWSRTSVGPIETWPSTLLVGINMLLAARHPMLLWWGEHLIQFYNDAYITLNIDKHPSALGQRGKEGWPEIWPLIAPKIEAVMERGEANWDEDQLIPLYRNGKLEDLYWTYGYSALRDPSGTICGTLVNAFETTGRVIAEQGSRLLLRELQQEQARLADLFQQAPAFFTLLHGPDHIFRMINPPYQELIGPRNLLGKPVREAVPESVEQGFVAILDEVYRTGTPFVGRGTPLALARGSDGTLDQRYVDFIYQPARDPDGDIYGIIVLGTDVTEGKRAEQALLRHWQTFDTALSYTLDFIYLMDLDGRITYANRPLLDYWQKSLDQALGCTFADLGYHAELAAKLQSQVREVIETRRPLRDEASVTEPVGAPGEFEYIFAPVLDEDGQVVSVSGSTRNITDRHRAEEQMRNALIERDTLLKEIHHRVKNNLQVIVSLLNLQSHQLTNPAALAAFQDAQGRVRAIARIHETLYGSANLAQVDFEHYARVLVEDIFAFHEASSDRLQLTFVTEELVLDIDQAIPLGLILNELVTNALKHAFVATETGIVEVSLRRLQQDGGNPGGVRTQRAWLCVCDNGSGMPKDFDLATAESMGMHLVRILARQLHGEITLKSENETRICVSFPITSHDVVATE